MGGILRFPNGRLTALRPVTDPEWAEQNLRRSVQPKALWSLTTPLLLIGENLITSLDVTVPLLGIDGEGRTTALLFDLRVERPLPATLGEAIIVLHWAERLTEEQLETFARYFWNDPQASLFRAWAQAYGRSERDVSFTQQAQVHLLSWRSLPVLWDLQAFLNRHGLAISLFTLHTLQGEQGETALIAAPVGAHPVRVGAVSPEPAPVHKMGEAETFLRSLEAPPQ